MALFHNSTIWFSCSYILLSYFIALPIFNFFLNYRAAKKTGLRILCSPITPYTLLWQLASSLCRPTLKKFQWYRAIDWTCAYQDDDKLHRELGLNFLIVSPGLTVLCSSDPATIKYGLDKWREFVKPDNVNGLLGTFGPNVDTPFSTTKKSNGESWIRHRKLTAPCFSERASSTVWRKALQQSDSMVRRWLVASSSPPSIPSSPSSSVPDHKMTTITTTTTSLVQDTSNLALNVISSIAFSTHESKNSNNNDAPTGASHTLSLRDSLITIMSTSISPAVEGFIPYLAHSKWAINLLPRQARKLLTAMVEFRAYMDEMISRERRKILDSQNESLPKQGEESGETGYMNLIQTLLSANTLTTTNTKSKEEKAKEEEEEEAKPKARLSDTELRGNIFIFTIGGLESTSITLAYAIALLAVHPDVQEWVAEEVREVMNSGDGEDLEDYTQCFPRLKRVRAVMYETLRLYNPSPPLPRSRSHSFFSSSPSSFHHSLAIPTTSSTSTFPPSMLPLPPTTQLMLNSWALHTSASHYTSPKVWDPKRWIRNPESKETEGQEEEEDLIHPNISTPFFAWGTGPRICPGMKFSQVEFTAVVACVLKKAVLDIADDDDDDDNENENENDDGVGEEQKNGKEKIDKKQRARQGLLSVLRDSLADPLLLHVREPEKIRLRIVKR